MDTLFACLASLPGDDLGTVVHIGAGLRALDEHAAGQAQRLVLVEGDPDRAGALAERASRLPGVEVHPLVVAPQDGDATWRRYNLPTLDGCADAAPLATYYPRLRELGHRTVSCIALQAFVEQLMIAAEGAATNVLVLDVPGMAAGLIESLDARTLAAFDAVVVRDCSDAAFAGPGGHDAAVASLLALGYSSLRTDADSEPLWPVTLCRFDATRHQRTLAREQEATISTLREQLAQELARSSDLRAEVQAQSDAAARQTDLANSRYLMLEEARQRHREFEEELRASGKRHDEQSAELHALRQRAAEQDSARSGLEEELRASNGRHDAQSAELQALRQQAKEQDDVRARLEDELRASSGRNDVQSAELQALRQQAKEQDDVRARLEDELRASNGRNDAQSAELQAWRQQAKEQEDVRARLEDELRVSNSRHDAQSAELQALRQQAKEQDDVRARLEDDIRSASADAARLHGEVEASGAAIRQAEAAMEQLRAEAAAHLVQLEAEHGLQIEEANARATRQTGLADKRYLEIDALKQVVERTSGFEEQAARLGRDLQELRLFADGVTRDADTLRAEKAAAEASLRELSTEHAQGHQRLAELQAEVQALRERAADLDRQRAEQEHWHRENAKWAHSLQKENEQLVRELEPLRGAQTSLATTSAELQTLKGSFGSQIAERDARQRLLDIEILKAEAQLDLIKDVLIREKNF